jgi:hypothetical protein
MLGLGLAVSFNGGGTTTRTLSVSPSNQAAEKRLAGQEALREYADPMAPQMDRRAPGELMYDFSSRQHSSMMVPKEGLEAETETQRAALRSRSRRLLDDAPTMLTQCMVPPTLTAGGLVKLEPAQIHPGQPLRLVVTVGGEAHEFLFDTGS